MDWWIYGQMVQYSFYFLTIRKYHQQRILKGKEKVNLHKSDMATHICVLSQTFVLMSCLPE